MIVSLIIASLILAFFLFAPRPKLNSSQKKSTVPDLGPAELEAWLSDTESQQKDLLDEAKAHIQWANPNQKIKTPYCFLYLHGFSASWQETAPISEELGKKFSANILQARISGHGCGPSGMLTPAEDWLQSITDQFDLAQKLGDKVIIIATSTGAPLTVWLAVQKEKAKNIAACIFLSPNFRIRNAFGFLLTWPLAPHWIHHVLGKDIKWEPQSELEAKVWTHEYSTLSLVEMQKVVDWSASQKYENFSIPMAMMYMKNDETIFPPAAIKIFEKWGSKQKSLIKVQIDGDATDHVFVGSITAPHRIDWSLDQLNVFLESTLNGTVETQKTKK